MVKRLRGVGSSSPDSPVSQSFLKHESFLKRFVKRFLPKQEDVDEVVQESFLKAYAAELKRPIEEPKPFLFQIARNEALSRLRKHSSRIVDYIEEIDASLDAGEGAPLDIELEQRQMLGIACEGLATLPQRSREAFLLRMVQGMSHKEIAKTMDISVSTVEKHLALALQRCSKFVLDWQRGQTDNLRPDEAKVSRVDGSVH